MDSKSLVKEIIRTLEDLCDPQRKEMSKTYFPTSMKVIGVSNPDLKAVIKALRSQHRNWTGQEWIDLCKQLVATAK